MGPLTKRIERGPNAPAEVKPEEQKGDQRKRS
jgi:hypothetical protein